MEEENKGKVQLTYCSPKVTKLFSQNEGLGDCTEPGSSNPGGCVTGQSVYGGPCVNDGSSAATVCGADGNAAAHCSLGNAHV